MPEGGFKNLVIFWCRGALIFHGGVGRPVRGRKEMYQRMVALLGRMCSETPQEKLETDPQYLAIAIQYYIAGRSATFACLFPVAGNLFHHAVEMLLKYYLLESHPLKNLKYKFRHNLSKLWREFKKLANEPALEKFNGLVSGLNKVEELRYPMKSYIFTMSASKAQNSSASGPGVKGFRQFNLNLEEIDEFVTAILKGRVNSGWINALFRNGGGQVAVWKGQSASVF